MGTLMSNGRKVLMVFSRDGRLCTKTYTSDGKLAWELEGDLLLKFAVDVAKGDTLVRISGTDVIAEEDYKVGDYLYFAKGTFHPTEIRFNIYDNNGYDYYSEIRFLKGLDISQIKSFYRILGGWGNAITGATKAKVIDVSHFDTKNVTDMHTMFCGCTSVKKLDVSNFDTSKATNMQSMFSSCTSLTSLDLSHFNTSKVTNMGYMFYYYSSLTNIIFGSKWGTQTSTEANALTLDLSTIATSKSYKLTDDTYNSMLTMYDRASAGLTTMTIKFSKKHNLPDGFAEKMSALGYTITLV